MSFDIDIEPEMIALVMEITGADTFNEAVEMALRHVIAVHDPANPAGDLWSGQRPGIGQ